MIVQRAPQACFFARRKARRKKKKAEGEKEDKDKTKKLGAHISFFRLSFDALVTFLLYDL